MRIYTLIIRLIYEHHCSLYNLPEILLYPKSPVAEPWTAANKPATNTGNIMTTPSHTPQSKILVKHASTREICNKAGSIVSPANTVSVGLTALPCKRLITTSYRAMHFSAKRGLAIACRLSVRLSVTLVNCDHIGWKSWKLIARTISPTPSLFVAKRRSIYSQGNMGKFWGD